MEEARESAAASTSGIHHIGLTVGKLEETAAFFVEQLGWKLLRRDPAYPAIFVSDGQVMVTLWQAKGPGETVPFDRFRVTGLPNSNALDRAALELGREDTPTVRCPCEVTHFQPPFVALF